MAAGENTDYTGIVGLKVIVDAKQLKTFMKDLKSIPGVTKQIKANSKQLAIAGDALKKKGFGSPAVSKAMGNFRKNFDKFGVSIRETGKHAGKFTDTFSGNILTNSKLVERMGKGMVLAKKRIFAAYGPDSRATVESVTKAMRAQGIPMFKINQGLKTMTTNWKSSGVRLGENGKLMDSTGKKQLYLKDAMKSTAKHGIKPFRGEFLSLMFAGMQLQATFGSMVKSVLQMTGIFDAFRGILASILLPILMPLISKYTS